MAGWLNDYLRTALADLPVLADSAEPGEGHLVPPIMAQKMAAYIQVPAELLMDSGVIPDTRPRKPVPWRYRLKRKVNAARTWPGGPTG